MPEVACVNGEFSPIDSAKISINDRGLQFGDSLYEVLRAYDCKPFLFNEHFKRLKEGCKKLAIGAEEELALLPQLINRGLKLSEFSEALVYIQLTRGTQPRSLLIDPQVKPNLIITFREIPQNYEHLRQSGVTVCLTEQQRWANCHLKTTNLLANVLASNFANKRGYFEALFLNRNNQVTEGSSSTLFCVIDESLVTPPLSPAILPGVNRELVLERVAPRLNIAVSEKQLGPGDLECAQEIFLTSTSFLIVPVVKLEESVIGIGKPGPVFRKIATFLNEEIDRFRDKT